MNPVIDWGRVTKGSIIRIQRAPSAAPFEAEFLSLKANGEVYFSIKNKNGGNILSSAHKNNVIDVVSLKGAQEKPIVYSCLRADGIPRDCDCCEGYDSRVCYPIATQFKMLMEMTPRTKVDAYYDHSGNEIAICSYCKYVFKDSTLPDICPGCGRVIMNTFRAKCER